MRDVDADLGEIAGQQAVAMPGRRLHPARSETPVDDEARVAENDRRGEGEDVLPQCGEIVAVIDRPLPKIRLPGKLV